MKLASVVFGLLAAGFAASAAESQTSQSDIVWRIGETETAKMSVDSLRVDLNAPTVPAAAIIGADDVTLTTVRAATDLTAQLLSGFDQNGVLQTGLAFGGNPYLWTNPRETLGDYRKGASSFIGLLKRTQVGVATKQLPDNDTNGVALGISASWQLFTGYDLRQSTDGYTCLERVLADLQPVTTDLSARASRLALRTLKERNAKLANIDPEAGLNASFSASDALTYFGIAAPGGQNVRVQFILAELDLYEEQYIPLRDQAIRDLGKEIDLTRFKTNRGECDKVFTDYLASQDSLVLTLAQAYVADDGKYDSLASDKAAIYLQYRTGSKNPFQKVIGVPVTGLLSYATDETIAIDDTTEDKADRFLVGLGTALEGEGQALDFQISYSRADFSSARPGADEFRASIAYSHKISKGVWIEFKAGTKNSDELSDDSFAGVSFKFSPAILGG